jgi:hypothetical protein
VGLFEDVARIAERGLFDLILFGDSTGIPNTREGNIDAAVRHGVAWPRLDMSPWITAMSRVTSHLGFGLTYVSTFMHPFYVARLLNSLDHITNGRIAFNVITSQRRADAEHYGFDELMEHGARYDRMEEFVDVCKALWASVDADAFVWDRARGLVADPAKVRAINHVGRFFKAKGPLSVPPSPRGRPVLIQAGGSPRGGWWPGVCRFQRRHRYQSTTPEPREHSPDRQGWLVWSPVDPPFPRATRGNIQRAAGRSAAIRHLGSVSQKRKPVPFQAAGTAPAPGGIRVGQ